MNDRSTLLLEHHLKELKLPSFLREYEKMAAQCASEGVDHPQYLLVNDQEGRTAGDYDVLIQNLIWAPVGATPDSRRFHYPIESIYSAFAVKQTLHLGFSLDGEPLEHLGHWP